MSASETIETYVLENLVPRFVAEGFDVFVHPPPAILPSFMKSYRPDANALRGNKKIAIEVVQPGQGVNKKNEGLQEAIAQHSDWEFRVVYAAPLTAESIDVAPRSSIDRAVARVIELKTTGQNAPALVMAWATLEAVGRALLPEKFSRPQSPERLMEVLASEGFLTPNEADMLRPAISLRNATVHGGLDSAVDERLLDQFIAILRTLADFVH
jgi:hypothetical protein